MVRLSFIAINYNDPENFHLFYTSILRSYQTSNNQSQITITIIDDGSSPPLPSYDFFHNIEIVRLPRTKHSSRACARSYAVKYVNNLYNPTHYVFLDGDGYVEPSFIDNYYQHFTQHSCHFVAGKCAIVQNVSSIKHIDGRDVICNMINIPFNMLTTKWIHTYGCNIAISRELYEQIGGWDYQFKGWGVEDIEFAYRVWLQYPQYDILDNYWYKLPDSHDGYKGDIQYEQCAYNLQYAYDKHRRLIWMDCCMLCNELLSNRYSVFDNYDIYLKAIINVEHKHRYYLEHPNINYHH